MPICRATRDGDMHAKLTQRVRKVRPTPRAIGIHHKQIKAATHTFSGKYHLARYTPLPTLPRNGGCRGDSPNQAGRRCAWRLAGTRLLVPRSTASQEQANNTQESAIYSDHASGFLPLQVIEANIPGHQLKWR